MKAKLKDLTKSSIAPNQKESARPGNWRCQNFDQFGEYSYFWTIGNIKPILHNFYQQIRWTATVTVERRYHLNNQKLALIVSRPLWEIRECVNPLHV